MTADRLQEIKHVVLCRYKEILFNIFVYKHRLQMPSKHVCPQDTVFLFFSFFFFFFLQFYKQNVEYWTGTRVQKKLRKIKRESVCGLAGKSHPGALRYVSETEQSWHTFPVDFQCRLGVEEVAAGGRLKSINHSMETWWSLVTFI